MVIDRKPTGRTLSVPLSLAIGAAISIGITLAGTGILAKLLDTERMAWENIGYGIVVILLTASFSGSMGAYCGVKRQRMLMCMMAGLIYFGILLSITALFFGGQYEGVGVTGAVVLAGSAAAGMLGLRSGGRQKGRKVRRAHR